MQDRIRERIEKLETTAHAVSLKASGGRSKDVIANIYRGTSKNPRSDTMQNIADALGVTVDWLLHGDGEPPPPKLDQPPRSNLRIAQEVQVPLRGDLSRNLPVMGTAAGSLAGAFVFDGGVIDYVMRPPALAHVKDAYAVYIDGSSMEPAHLHGELRFVHPHRPPQIGDTVVVVAKYTEDGPQEGFIKRLVKRTPTHIVVEQFNPKATIEFNRAYVSTFHKVMSMNDLFGM